MEENKTAIIIVAVVAIVAIFSLMLVSERGIMSFREQMLFQEETSVSEDSSVVGQAVKSIASMPGEWDSISMRFAGKTVARSSWNMMGSFLMQVEVRVNE